MCLVPGMALYLSSLLQADLERRPRGELETGLQRRKISNRLTAVIDMPIFDREIDGF